MKQILSKEQITANVERLFPGKSGRCALITDNFFIIDFPGKAMIAIENKQVFVRWSYAIMVQKMAEYETECQNYNLVFIKKQFKGMLFIPLIYNRKTAHADALQQHELLLGCVGIVKRQKPETELTRLQKLAGKEYAGFYKLIQEVQVCDAYVEQKQTKALNIEFEALVVEHASGKFSFPISDIVPNDSRANEEIKNIFFNLLDIPVTSCQRKAA